MRILDILTLLQWSDFHYTHLYNHLRIRLKHTQTNNQLGHISPRDFTIYLRKAEEKGWISRDDNKKRGSRVEISMTRLGRLAQRYNITIDEYDRYFQTPFMIYFLIGIGNTYDLKKIQSGKLKKIPNVDENNSISVQDISSIKRSDSQYRLYGYSDLVRFSEEKTNGLLKFLEEEGILHYHSQLGRYTLKNIAFYPYINWCWGILLQNTLRTMIEIVYSSVRKPSPTEIKWMYKLFGKKWTNKIEQNCHYERSKINRMLRSQNIDDQQYYLIKGNNIIYSIKEQQFTLRSYKQLVEDTFLKPYKIEPTNKDPLIKKQNERFIAHTILNEVIPDFILNDNFIKEMKIQEDKKFLSKYIKPKPKEDVVKNDFH